MKTKYDYIWNIQHSYTYGGDRSTAYLERMTKEELKDLSDTCDLMDAQSSSGWDE